MPKKSKKEKKLERSGDHSPRDNEDTTQSDDDLDAVEKIKDSLYEAIENLSDKKSATRLSALEAFIKSTRLHFAQSTLESSFDTVLKKLTHCFVHGDDQEAILASKALEMFVITIGSLETDQLKKINEILLHRARDKEQSDTIRKQAINTFGMMNFLSCDGLDVINVMNQVKEFFFKEKAVSEAGIHTFSLLLTCIPSSARVREIESNKSHFLKLLEEHSFETMIEVGECIALMYEAMYSLNERDSQMDRLWEKISELSTVHSKQVGKKDKKVQRATFRDVLNAMENTGDLPVEKLMISKVTFEFGTWKKIIKYHQFRERLGEGISEHFQKNATVKGVFDIPSNIVFH